MEQFVVLYLGEAVFDEVRSIPYDQTPVKGSKHAFILFVRQQSAEPSLKRARALMIEHGWHEIVFKKAGLFDSEQINAPQWQEFRQHYEECLEHGDSLVWYPGK